MLRIECAIKSLHLRIRHNIIYAISLTRGATDRVPFYRCGSRGDNERVRAEAGGHPPNGEHGV